MDKPIKIERASISTITFVNKGSSAEIVCSYETLLPITDKPRIKFDGYNAVCLNSAVTLPQHNSLPVIKRMSNKPLHRVGATILRNGKFSYAKVKQNSNDSSAYITNKEGITYLVSADQPIAPNIYHSIIVKNGTLVSINRIRPILPKNECPNISGQNVPVGIFDMRYCFNQPNKK